MVRVVCQVLAREDRLTLLWSDGVATFPPYCLEKAAAAELQQLAAQAHRQLANLGNTLKDAAAAAKAGHQLAQIGHAMYRLLFQLDHPSEAAGQQVRTWLDGQARDGEVEQLHLLGDALDVPWTAVYDREPDQAAFASGGPDADCWKSFWGRRFAMFGGRRVQWLRGRQLPEKPAVVLAIDPTLRAGLPPPEQERLAQFLTGREIGVVETFADLADVFAAKEVDLLYVFAKREGNGLRLGGDLITPATLERAILPDADDETPLLQTLLVLNACPGDNTAASGDGHGPLAAFERFATSGLIGAVQPLDAVLANQCGLALLADLLDRGGTVAGAMAAVRRLHPFAGTHYLACCPPDLRTAGIDSAQADRPLLELPDEPYQPLTALREDTAAFLVGREYDVAGLAGVLDDQDTRVVLVHGAPAIGKASLLHAGLIPYLEDQVVGYQFLRERADVEQEEDERDYPVLTIPATNDLAGQLAIGLLEFCGLPFAYATPTGQTVTIDLPGILAGVVQGENGEAAALPEIDALRIALRKEPELFGIALEAITAQLPFELVLLIENGEELFSLQPTGANQREADRALAMLESALRSTARARILVSLQTEFVGRFHDRLVRSPDEQSAVRTFLVRELSEEELLDILLQPTSTEPLPMTAEVPYQKYGFAFEEGVAEDIAKQAWREAGAHQESAAALVHVLGSRLFELARRQEDKVVRKVHLKNIGGVEKGLAKHVRGLVNNIVSGSDRKALRVLLQKLVVHQPDASVTRGRLFENDFRQAWNGSLAPDALLARASSDETHLLDVNYLNIRGKEGNFVSLGHESLAPAVTTYADEGVKRSYGWSRMFDGLWITIPLLILLGVFAWTRIRLLGNDKQTLQDEKNQLKKILDHDQPMLAGMRWSAYTGQVRAADQAILAGDLVRARQALLSVKPLPAVGLDDLRGFEWHYLWHQMNLDQATLYGHRGTVNAVALTPDGSSLATASADGTVRLWDPSAGQELAKLELKGKSGLTPSQCVAFSRDGSLLAAGADDGVIRVWNVVRRPSLSNAPGVAALVLSMASGNAGTITSLGPFAVSEWVLLHRKLQAKKEPESLVLRAELVDKRDAVLAVAFSTDGKTVAAAGKDGQVRLWDLREVLPKVRKTLTEHSGAVLALAYSPDGQWLASGGADKKVVIWDVKENKKAATLEGHPLEVQAVAWTADGKTLATAGAQNSQFLDTGIIKLWDTATRKERQTPGLAVAPVFGLAFADDGKSLVTASKSNLVQVWDVATGRERAALRGHVGWVRSVAVANNGATVASGSYDGTAKFWLPEQHQTHDLLNVSTAPARSPVCAVVFSADDRWLATGTADGTIKIFNAATGQETKLLAGQKGAVLALAWAAEDNWLVSGGEDGKLRLWDVDPASKTYGTELDSVIGHTKEIACLSWPTEGKRFASGSMDGSAKIWSVDKGKIGKEPVGVATSDSPVHGLALATSRFVQVLLLATGHDDATVRIWNGENGKPLGPMLLGHTARVTAVAFMIDADENNEVHVRLISGSLDQSIKLWNVRTGKDIYSMRGHGGAVTSLALGQKYHHTLVSGSTDTMLKLWDPLIWEDRWTLQPQLGAIRAVAISSDSRTIAAAGQDGRVRIYRTGTEEGKGK